MFNLVTSTSRDFAASSSSPLVLIIVSPNVGRNGTTCINVLFKIDVHKATSLFLRVPVNVRCILEQVCEYRLLYSQKAEGRNLYCH